MLSSLRNMFRVPDLRNKILFTLLMLALYRLGRPHPGAGHRPRRGRRARGARPSRAACSAFLQLFSGGALTQFALFALGIMPYITSSIIMQILTVVIPKLEQWQEKGAVGQRKITQWTRYLTVAIAIAAVHRPGLPVPQRRRRPPRRRRQHHRPRRARPTFTPFRVIVVVLTLTAGTALLMWMGELITQRGIGNGMSLLIFASVGQRLPGARAPRCKAEKGNDRPRRPAAPVAVVLLVAIVFIEQGQRRIPVQFAKRVVGRRMYGGQSTYIPLKVNQSGVIPIIFASSVLYLPLLLTNVLPADGWGDVGAELGQRQPRAARLSSGTYVIVYGLLIIGFAYFYTAIAFDPAQQADNIRKQGGFIPGIRPGPQTERYLAKILTRITLPGRPVHRLHRPAARRSCSPSPTCRTSRSPAPRSSSPWAWPSRR